jgi:hypothetical protein
MSEDQLTKYERLRLEALNQATQSFPSRPPSTIVAVAKQFESYVLTGEDNPEEFRAHINSARTSRTEETEEGTENASE